MFKEKKSNFEELWSPARQQLWPWSRSKVKVTAWCQLQGLVTRIMHAKYQCSIINTSEDMSKVKVFVTDGQTDRRTEWYLMSTAFAKGGGIKCLTRKVEDKNVLLTLLCAFFCGFCSSAFFFTPLFCPCLDGITLAPSGNMDLTLDLDTWAAGFEDNPNLAIPWPFFKKHRFGVFSDLSSSSSLWRRN